MNPETVKKEFFERFYRPQEDVRVYFSPGRVNLIGEHTDYNGGYVFPCALSYGTYLVCRKTAEPLIKMATTNFDFSIEISLDQLHEKIGDEWVNYPLGVFNEMLPYGLNPGGLEMLFSGNIPNKSGLSSSASIELVTAVALNDLYGLNLEQLELVKIGQAAENNFVGVNCGIMDQFAVAMGKKDKAIFLKCDTLEYELVPVELDGCKLIISNTNKSRGLSDSKYNERVSECRQAVRELSQGTPINNLAELSSREFNEYQHLISDPVVLKRARHVIFENERVIQAVDALKKGELETFGALMNDSHDSLKNDYEVTGIELDTLVEEGRKIPGVIGTRMTGAGFGGCTVSLVREESVDDYIRKLGEAYLLKTGIVADFYVAEIGDGAARI